MAVFGSPDDDSFVVGQRLVPELFCLCDAEKPQVVGGSLEGLPFLQNVVAGAGEFFPCFFCGEQEVRGKEDEGNGEQDCVEDVFSGSFFHLWGQKGSSYLRMVKNLSIIPETWV